MRKQLHQGALDKKEEKADDIEDYMQTVNTKIIR
jgi:hypothetical protein